MRNIYLIALFVLCSISCDAQYFAKSIYQYGFSYFISYGSIAQNSDSTFTMLTAAGTNNLYEIQLDNSGNIIGEKRTIANGVTLDGAFATDRLADSAFIVACFCFYVEFDYHIYLAKINPSGDLVWQKSVGKPDTLSKPFKVLATSDSGYIVGGFRYWHVASSDDIGRACLVKMNNTGITQWAKMYNYDMYPCEIRKANNGFLVGGTFEFSSDSNHTGVGIVFKTDNFGHFLWGKKYPDVFGIIWSIAEDNTSFILAGTTANTDFMENATLMKIDSLGNTLWVKEYNFGQGAIVQKIIKTLDGGYLALGVFDYHTSIDSNAFFYLKTDSLGNVIWCKKYGGPSMGYSSNSLLEEPNGNLVSLAYYYTDQSNFLIQRTNSFGGNSSLCERDRMPTVYSPTFSDSNITLLETPYVDTLISIPFSVAHDSIVSVDSCNVGWDAVPNVSTKLQAKLYPNPTNGPVNVEVPVDNYDLEVFNSFGIRVFEQKQYSGNASIDLSVFPRGYYTCRIITPDNKVWTEGLILK